MNKIIPLLLIIGIGAGGWFFFKKYKVEGLSAFKVVPRDATAPSKAPGDAADTTPLPSPSQPPVQRKGDTIRVASFDLEAFGETKAGKPQVMELLGRIVREFDIIALQGITSRSQGVLPRLIEKVNKSGRRFDYIIGGRVGPEGDRQQFAFLFDTCSVAAARQQIFTVKDPDDVLRYEPLASWFQVRGPSEKERFTFTLVNVCVDPQAPERELEYMDDIFRAVQNVKYGEGNNVSEEDDVLVVGNFQQVPEKMNQFKQIRTLDYAVDEPYYFDGQTPLCDNIFFQLAATSEYEGKGGHYDFLRVYNLTLDQASQLSNHLPVWAEFSIFENGRKGRVAQRD